MKLLNEIIESVAEKNSRHGKKLNKVFNSLDETYQIKAEAFFERYKTFAEKEGKDLNYGIDCYLKMIGVMMHEQVEFLRTGEYSCKSFEDANIAVYNNPNVMEYYMHGLLLSQFLWKHHYKLHEYFEETMQKLKASGKIKNYLEIGGGHGLGISQSIKILGHDTGFTCVDISKSSLEIAKSFVEDDKVKYVHSDVFEYEPSQKFDMISMGEVLEHVEDPVALLKRLGYLLNDDGLAFITTPTNSPAIDHIYLFRNKNEIIDVINKAGFEVIDEYTIYSEDVSEKKAIKFKVPMMYAGLIKKK